jgi:glucokinase
MFLGIEIGGTKLQLGVGDGKQAKLQAIERRQVDLARGALGILEQIEQAGSLLMQRFPIKRIGIGFGGPIDAINGNVRKSHQVLGWENFPLVEWCRKVFDRPTVMGNDCDSAALAEATLGAGAHCDSLFYVTVGTGVGGGLVVDKKVFGANRPAIAEIGHLRPGLQADRDEDTVESLAAGPGIAAAAQARLGGVIQGSLDLMRLHGEPDRQRLKQFLLHVREAEREFFADLLARCSGDPEKLTAKMVAQAAAEGNEVAEDVLRHAVRALGWGIAQVITLIAPEIIVVGGGVSLIGDQFFFDPLREEIARYVFPPLAGSYRVVPAALGEEVVTHGAIALAAEV